MQVRGLLSHYYDSSKIISLNFHPPHTLFLPSSEDGYVRMFLRGRPVAMHVPDQLRDSYSLDHKGVLPDHKLKLEWVYPSMEMVTYAMRG